jgi:hypothetical protein
VYGSSTAINGSLNREMFLAAGLSPQFTFLLPKKDSEAKVNNHEDVNRNENDRQESIVRDR